MTDTATRVQEFVANPMTATVADLIALARSGPNDQPKTFKLETPGMIICVVIGGSAVDGVKQALEGTVLDD